jgi:integrase
MMSTRALKTYPAVASAIYVQSFANWFRYICGQFTDRFTEHDLRARCGSDAESLARTQQLLGHADSKITERVYRRKPEVVRPLR